MLVCNVSELRASGDRGGCGRGCRCADSPGTGNVVFATLVDDLASVGDRVDATSVRS
jgi:hypothetical protein